jgi:hypothetical protein
MSIILVRVFSSNVYYSETFGGDRGNDFSFIGNVGPEYPKSIILYCGERVDGIQLSYSNGIQSAGNDQGTPKQYTFKANEYLNYLKACKDTFSDGLFSHREQLVYIILKTNKSTQLTCGKPSSDCTELWPSDRYAIAGFYGKTGWEIDRIGCIYHIFYYTCDQLKEGQFCNYDQTKILTKMPDGFFLNDTVKKTVDKCYSSCKNCTNYGNESDHNCDLCISNYYKKIDNSINCFNGIVERYFLFDNYYQNCYFSCNYCYGFGNERNHNCSECISNYEFIDEPDFELNCYENCSNYKFNRKTYKFECSDQEYCLIRETLDKNKNEIIDNLDEITEKKSPYKSYILNSSNYTIFINPIGRYLNESNVNIDFSECEKILKKKYPSFSFTVLQINSKNSNPNCLNEDVEYVIYNQFWERIDLSCCKDTKITIQNKIPRELLDLEKIKNFKNKGVDIFNLKDDFFNDVCYQYSDENSGFDMILKDRVSDIYQNNSICGKECEYTLFDVESVYVNCSCNVKQNVSKEASEGNFKTFLNPFFYSNFGIIKCYKLVFGTKGKLKNIGFWIFGILILLHLPSYIYYCLNKINPIKNYINDEMVKHKYKTPTKKIESLDSTKTIDNLTETNKNKISQKIKEAKPKFDKINNCPPKTKYGHSLYFENKINNKTEIQTTSERNFNNENDKFSSNKKEIEFNKNQNTAYFYINEIIKINQNNAKYISKKSEKSLKNNYIINKRKKQRKHFKIVKNPQIYKENFSLILINANNINNYYPFESNYILNNYDYNEAIINEKRNFFRIFFIFIISKDDLLNLIFFNPPLELKPLRIIIFIFNYICDLSLNALFYLSDNISDQYRYKGKFRFFYTLINNLTISLSSTIIAFILLFIFQSLTESSQKIKDLFLEQEELLKNNKEYKVSEKKKLEIQKNIEKILKCLKIKIIVFFILEFLINLFFYYYIIAFCHVYKSTQISWLLDSLYSYFLSFIITLCISFVFSILYKLSIKFKIKILYKVMMFYYE